MNFKTTAILLVLLLAIGGYLFFTRDKEPTEKKSQEHKLVDIAQASDVSKVVIATGDGKQLIFEKTGRDWKMARPVVADADTAAVNTLINDLIGLKSNNQVDPRGSPRTGLDQPQFTIDLTVGDKTTNIKLGDRLAVGNGVYARVSGKEAIEVVPADILDRVDKPASQFRQLKLIDAPSTDIKRVWIAAKEATIKLSMTNAGWEITEPALLPADTAAVTDLLGALTGMRAVSFVENAALASDIEKTEPKLTVSFSTHLPATQPASQPASTPAMTTVAFLDYDLTKKNVYVKLSNSPYIALVSASAMDSFKKNTSDFRDKKVVDVNPEEVSRFSIATAITAATQPTSRPAKKAELVIERRKEGGDRSGVPFLPTTVPTTTPSKLTWPGPKGAAWLIAGAPGGDADEGEVTSFLGALHPFRADKFLDKNPATQPTGTYVVKLHTEAAGGAKMADVEIRFLDRGSDQPFVGEYNGLVFEVSRTTLGRFLEGDFKKKPGGGAGGFPGGPGGAGGLPPGFGQ